MCCAVHVCVCPAGPQNAQLLDQVLKLLPPRMHKWMLGKFTDPGGLGCSWLGCCWGI